MDIAKNILEILGKPKEMLNLSSEGIDQYKRSTMNSYKAKSDLNWVNKLKLDTGIKETVAWYKRKNI